MSFDEIRGLLAQAAIQTVETSILMGVTHTEITALAAEVRSLAANTGAAPGAAPPVLALTAQITPFSSSLLSLLPCFAWAVSVADSHQAA